jgi:hypothetical protein
LIRSEGFSIPDRSDCPAFIQVACIQNGVTIGAKHGKNQNLRQRSTQYSSKMMKRIDLRQNLMKNGSRTVNRWCMRGRRWKWTVQTVPIFIAKKLKPKSVLEIQTQVFLWFWLILFGLTDFVSVWQIFMVCQTECLTLFFNFREVCCPPYVMCTWLISTYLTRSMFKFFNINLFNTKMLRYMACLGWYWYQKIKKEMK